jgi:hypothetical protein
VLRDPGIGGFEVRTLLNEPAYEVSLAVEEFFANRRPDDLLLVHFSCHGVKDQDGELYFAAANTVLRALGATAVAAEFVNRRMSRSRSRRVVLLLDCCYAGAFERGMTARAGAGVGIDAQFGGRGRAVITASSAMEYAFEGGELADSQELQPSVFTSALVEGLATGEADRDQDGMVALDELYDYVYDKVRAATPNQTPGKWAFGVQGDLYIARRARPVTTPAPLPPQLQEAIDSPFAAIRAAAVQELARLLQGRHAGLALAARRALQGLTEDDSRMVAAAAAQGLGGPPPPAPPESTPPKLALSATVVDFGRLAQHSAPPERRVRLGNAGGGTLNARAAASASWLKLRQVGDDLVVGVDTDAVGENDGTVSVDSDGGSATIRVQARVEPDPLTASGTTATTHRDAPPELPKGARSAAQQDAAVSKASPAPAASAPPVAAPAPTPATSAGGVVTGTAAEPALPATGVDHGIAPQPRADPRLLVAGQLAIAGAALLVVGVFPAYRYDNSLWQGRPTDHFEMDWFKWYLLAIAVPILGAGGCTLIPRTRRLIGPGLLLGVAAASTWGLPFLVSDRLVFIDVREGWWVELVAHLVLVLAAGLTALALARTGEVRLARRPHRGELAWLVVVLGGAGALALIFHDRTLWLIGASPQATNWVQAHWDYARVVIPPSIWATAMALAVPTSAVLAVPRRFGVALLAGWIGGGAAFVYFHFQWITNEWGGDLDNTPIITFGFTLLALLVVTVLLARADPASRVEPRTQG